MWLIVCAPNTVILMLIKLYAEWDVRIFKTVLFSDWGTAILYLQECPFILETSNYGEGRFRTMSVWNCVRHVLRHTSRINFTTNTRAYSRILTALTTFSLKFQTFTTDSFFNAVHPSTTVLIKYAGNLRNMFGSNWKKEMQSWCVKCIDNIF